MSDPSIISVEEEETRSETNSFVDVEAEMGDDFDFADVDIDIDEVVGEEDDEEDDDDETLSYAPSLPVVAARHESIDDDCDTIMTTWTPIGMDIVAAAATAEVMPNARQEMTQPKDLEVLTIEDDEEQVLIMDDDEDPVSTITDDEQGSTINTHSCCSSSHDDSYGNNNNSRNSGGVHLNIIPQHRSIGIRSDLTTTHVCINIEATSLHRHRHALPGRAPVDIIVALDVSGSMSGAKLDSCKRTLEQLVPLLNHPKDRFGLVSYHEAARLEIPLQSLDSSLKQERARCAIRALQARGSTNLSAAIQLAAQELHALPCPNPVRSIFVLTDGHANKGIFDNAGLMQIIQNSVLRADRQQPLQQQQQSQQLGGFNNNNASSPVTMHCFGYGNDHDGDLLCDLARTAGGSYYFVENDNNVATAFGDALGGIFSVVAQNVTLKIVPDDSWASTEIVQVLHQDATRNRDGTYYVHIGDLFAEEIRNVVVEIQLGRPSTIDGIVDMALPHLGVWLSYIDTLASRQQHQQQHPPRHCSTFETIDIYRPWTSEVSDPNVQVTIQLLRIGAAHAIQTARAQAHQGALTAARTTIRQCRERIVTALQQANKKNTHDGNLLRQSPWIKMMLNDLQDIVHNGLQSRQSYTTSGIFQLVTRQAALESQRCAEADVHKQALHANCSTTKSQMTQQLMQNMQNMQMNQPILQFQQRQRSSMVPSC